MAKRRAKKPYCAVIVENSGNWESKLRCFAQKANAARKCQAINRHKGRNGARCYVAKNGKRLPGYTKTPYSRFGRS